MPLELSIIIPTHNSDTTIEKCLNSLNSQSYSRVKYEIIIVDDGSKDKTVELAKKAVADKIIEVEPCFQGKARNIGVKHADADLLAFIDSDCEAKNDWVESIVSELKNANAVTGPIHNGNPHSLIAWGEYFLEFGGFHKHNKRSAIRFLPGCNQGYSKKAFLKTSGFSEERISEDVMFGESLKKAGIQVFFIPQVQISHLCRTEIKKVSDNMKTLGKYSVRTRKAIPSIKYSSLMLHRSMIPLLFFGKIAKAASHSIKGKNFRKFFLSFPIVVLGAISFCSGIWEELGRK